MRSVTPRKWPKSSLGSAFELRAPLCVKNWCVSHMWHFRIIGLIWLALSLTALIARNPTLYWVIVGEPKYEIRADFQSLEFLALEFFVVGFLLLGVMAGFGLFRLKRWAAICTRMTGGFMLLYCLGLLLMEEYIHSHIIWLAASLFGVAFASYSLFVVWRFRPYDRAA